MALRPDVAIARKMLGAGSGTAAPVPAAGVTVVAQASDDFAWKRLQSAKDAKNANVALDAWLSGKVLLDLRCSAYLDAIGSATQEAANERKQVGLVGGLAATIMGLYGASTGVVAGTASRFCILRFEYALRQSFLEVNIHRRPVGAGGRNDGKGGGPFGGRGAARRRPGLAKRQ